MSQASAAHVWKCYFKGHNKALNKLLHFVEKNSLSSEGKTFCCKFKNEMDV